MIETATGADVVVERTRALCQAILDQPTIQSLRSNVEAFFSDEAAKLQFQMVMEKGEALQQKQSSGLPLSDEEVAEYEAHRQVMLGNPIARGFLEAREEMNRVQDTVNQYLTKMWEIGRVPEESDLGGCCNSSGCGCSH